MSCSGSPALVPSGVRLTDTQQTTDLIFGCELLWTCKKMVDQCGLGHGELRSLKKTSGHILGWVGFLELFDLRLFSVSFPWHFSVGHFYHLKSNPKVPKNENSKKKFKKCVSHRCWCFYFSHLKLCQLAYHFTRVKSKDGTGLKKPEEVRTQRTD